MQSQLRVAALLSVRYKGDLKAAKFALTKLLLRKHWARKTIADVFKFLDWVMALPEELDQQFITEVTQLQEENKMPFLAPFERRAMARGEALGEERGLRKGEARGLRKGQANGLRNSLLLILEDRELGEIPPAMQKRISAARATTLQRWIRRALHAESLDQVFDA